MKQWIPFKIVAYIALISTIVTLLIGIWAYLAVTGLDLLVTAKKTAPKVFVISAVISLLLWLIALAVFLVTRPHK